MCGTQTYHGPPSANYSAPLVIDILLDVSVCMIARTHKYITGIGSGGGGGGGGERVMGHVPPTFFYWGGPWCVCAPHIFIFHLN